MPSVVLPPVSTIGLSAADVPTLVSTIREQMLAALHEISGTHARRPEEKGSPLAAARPSPHSTSLSGSELEPTVDTRQKEGDGGESIMQAADESASPGQRREESDKGAETEEDEGMVLVDRPTS